MHALERYKVKGEIIGEISLPLKPCTVDDVIMTAILAVLYLDSLSAGPGVRICEGFEHF